MYLVIAIGPQNCATLHYYYICRCVGVSFYPYLCCIICSSGHSAGGTNRAIHIFTQYIFTLTATKKKNRRKYQLRHQGKNSLLFHRFGFWFKKYFPKESMQHK